MAPLPPRQMQAQQLHAYSTPYRLVADAPVPVPTHPNDILIRVDAASYCHTDAVLAAGQMPGLPLSFPHVGSHEFAGTVVAHAENPSEVSRRSMYYFLSKNSKDRDINASSSCLIFFFFLASGRATAWYAGRRRWTSESTMRRVRRVSQDGGKFPR